MATRYTSEMLHQMKGQAVKDAWHSMIGKPAGIRNTTGLKSMEDIIQAILKAQEDPDFLNGFYQKTPKQEVCKPLVELMPPKKKLVLSVKPPPKPSATHYQAIESTEIPLVASEVKRISVRKLHLDNESYFLDPTTNELYSIQDNKPGVICGIWDAETKTIQTG
jgi:hypothetical protein